MKFSTTLVLVNICYIYPIIAQSLPEWGPWWQQPIAREYGGEARDPNQSLPPDEQIRRQEIEAYLQNRDEEQIRQQQQEVNSTLQQKKITERLQQRIADELIEDGNTEEVIRQKNLDDLIQQERYDSLYRLP